MLVLHRKRKISFFRENIAYGVENPTDEQIEEAAKLANAHNFIMKLPNVRLLILLTSHECV